MIISKLEVFNKVLAKGIKPTSPDFLKSVVSEIKQIIESAGVNLLYVAPETLAKIDEIAQHFKSKTHVDWLDKRKV